MKNIRKFLRLIAQGLAALTEGMQFIILPFAPIRNPAAWRYEDHFGTNTEQLATDWEITNAEFREALEYELREEKQNNKDKP